jgi:hypothetical protein
MAIRETERYLPGTLGAADLGEAATASGTGGLFALVSYVTSPVRTGTLLDYVLLVTGTDEVDEYDWVVTNSAGGIAHTATTTYGTFAWSAPVADIYEVSVTPKGTSTMPTLKLTQQAKDIDPTLESNADPHAWVYDDSLRELASDLKPYIAKAASDTGPNGIPERLLASVLAIEILMRPKGGSSTARVLPRHVRDAEIARVAEFIDEYYYWTQTEPLVAEAFFLLPGYREKFARASLGVGQVALATAAMSEGKFTWRDADKAHREFTRQAIADDFNDNVSYRAKIDIFNLLRFPKTNVAVAARLLANLKNRVHRYPTIKAADLAKSPRPVGIIATEYHLGGTTTDSVIATIEPWYGHEVMDVLIHDGAPLFPELYFT